MKYRMMNIRFTELLFFLLVLFAILSFTNPVKGDLVINLENIKKPKGMIWLALYDSEETLFVKKKSILKGVEVNEKGDITVVMDEVQFGTYALAIFHDENSNGELDKNFFGIPTEPYAFARPPKSKWRAPYFEELTFSFNKTNQVVDTKLGTWWDQP